MQRYLLDTHILAWWLTESHRLPGPIKSLLATPVIPIFYSVLNPWELVIKESSGKYVLDPRLFDMLPQTGFARLVVEDSHVVALRALPPLHRDPFDRMLVAQAAAERLTLITADKRLAEYPIKTLLVEA